MMKRATIAFSCIITLLCACREKITVDVPQSSDKVVVEGYVSTETDSSVILLSKTVSYYSNQGNPPVRDAIVLVNSDTFYHTVNGIYKPKPGYAGIVNTGYTLKIYHQGKT